jgi:hypothetical protein
MELEKKNKNQESEIYLESSSSSSSSSSSPDLKIGNTKIFLMKENYFSIQASKIILDSIHESLRYNITNIKTKPHRHANTQINQKQKQKPNAEKEIYETIEFKAESIMPLTKFLDKSANKHGTDYNTILHFIGNIGNQITFLRNQGYSIPFFSLEDFIVINHTIFCFMNDNKIFKIDKQTLDITIDYPISYHKNNSFIPPDIPIGQKDQMDKIPIDIYFTSIYYSLAQICVYVFVKERIIDQNEFEKIAGPFVYTPLYWCIKRCLDKDQTKRILLYV